MTFNQLFGLTGFFGLISALILCLSLSVLSIVLNTKKTSNLTNIFHILICTQTALLGLALISLNILLQRDAFEYSLVFNTIESAMPWYQKIGGMWSGQSSSLLFWSFIMSAASLLSVHLAKRFSCDLYVPSIVLIFECTLIFFIFPNVFFFNPFEKIWVFPSGTITHAFFKPLYATLLIQADGQGMSPNLSHTAMLLHPPFLYLGLIGFFIPYSFTLSSWIQDDQNTSWVAPIFPYVLATWICLTIGMFLGSWWAYTISGWGGYWGWDAVEISGLLPWLLSIGLIHSMRMHTKEKTNMKWISLFSSGVIIFTLFGILITRSGILESVHAYTSGSMGPALTTLIVLHILAMIYTAQKSYLRINKELTNQPISYPENLIKWFNVCLLILVAIFLFGQTLPLSSQLILGERRSFSQSNYKTASSPLLLTLVILAGLYPIAHLKDTDENKFNRLLGKLILVSVFCPLIILAFSAASIYTLLGFWAAAFLLCSWLFSFTHTFLFPFFTKPKKKNQGPKINRLGSTIIHLGFAVMAFGILGVENLSSTHDMYIKKGDEVVVEGFTLLSQNDQYYLTDNNVERSEFSISIYSPVGYHRVLTTTIDYYPKLDTLHTQPAIFSGLFRDLKVLVHKLPKTPNEEVGMFVAIFPLMNWIWAGGILLVIGGLMVLYQLSTAQESFKSRIAKFK